MNMKMRRQGATPAIAGRNAITARIAPYTSVVGSIGLWMRVSVDRVFHRGCPRRASLAIVCAFLSACQTVPPQIVTSSAQPIEIPKVLIEPCISAGLIPPLPPNAMPPRGSDPRQLANGAAANSERLLQVIQAQRELLEACAKLSKEQK